MKIFFICAVVAAISFGAGWATCRWQINRRLRQLNAALHEKNAQLAKAIAENK